MQLIRVDIFLVESPNRINLRKSWDDSLYLETNDPYIAGHGSIHLGLRGEDLIFGAYTRDCVPFMAPWEKVLLKKALTSQA